METCAIGLPEASDDDLVLRAQAGDDEAYAELMRRTSSVSLKLAMSILRDREDAEEEVQSSYLSGWQHVREFQRESKFSTWISRIVVNRCLGRLRKLRGAIFVPVDDVVTMERAPDPERRLAGKELSRVLEAEIHRLPPLLRQVLILRDIDQLSSAEAADRLRISVPAVKSRLLRARSELRNRLEKHCGRMGPATLTA
ncbi:MAG: sigma-70 family RNA polymerase sigma factor [Acidobacteriota bacterium]|nr:sigma-70 family RNA polymerase sigma factor [Acidobacteriota bacterium]